MDTPSDKPKILDVHDVNLQLLKSGDDLGVKRTQHIPDAHIRDLRRQYDDSLHAPDEKNGMHRVASIPTAVIDQWQAQGFDFYKEPAKAILKKLREEGLDYFITSKKAI